MVRSLAVSAVVTLVTVLLAYPMAYYLSFHVAQRKALWLFLITIPFWTSYLLRVFAWKIILGYNGAINASLLELGIIRSEEHTSELQSLMRNSYAVFCLKKKTKLSTNTHNQLYQHTN